jgi:primosomal protein N' (replication factor Y)
MREEFRKGNKSIFSDTLHDALKKTLDENGQAILFLNRRGSASSIVCRDCGFKLKCENCDITMTYHARTLGQPVVICHHCGQIGKIPINCPNCKGVNIRFLGVGTERIEEETKKLFKNARVLRADKDTTSRKNSFEQIYSSFKKHEADILIGTQMIGKGLHIPNVKLVGVILADIGLNIPDFRSSERSFQLLTQVAGRAGRAQDQDELGEVIIQTYSPDHFALQATETQDYTAFYNVERQQRKLLHYPPFTRLAKLSFEFPKFLDAKHKAEELEVQLKKILNQSPDLKDQIQEITSYPAFIPRLHNKYRYRILIKGTDPIALLNKLDPKNLSEARIDIDPISTG